MQGTIEFGLTFPADTTASKLLDDSVKRMLFRRLDQGEQDLAADYPGRGMRFTNMRFLLRPTASVQSVTVYVAEDYCVEPQDS